MRLQRSLPDQLFGRELDRMRQLKQFPDLPTARQLNIRVLRQVASNDSRFLHELVTYFVDNVERFPSPQEMVRRAAAMRSSPNRPPGNPECEQCHGSGWVSGTRTVMVRGEPQVIDCSARCACGAAAPPVEA